MSRIGKKPIEIPAGIEISLSQDGKEVTAKGNKGELKVVLREKCVKAEKRENQIFVTVADPESKKQKAYWGLYRTLIANMLEGLTKGFEKKLEVNGVGYRVSLSGQKLILNVGFSHPVEFEVPAGIQAKVEGNIITLQGIDKQLVGQTAASIRKIRKPEPYKGKGIKYVGEEIRRKAGKTAKGSE